MLMLRRRVGLINFLKGLGVVIKMAHPSFAEWQENILKKVLERMPERLKEFRTASGIPAERVALPETLDERYLHETRLSRTISLYPRDSAHHVPRASLDDAAVCGFFYRGRIE